MLKNINLQAMRTKTCFCLLLIFIFNLFLAQKNPVKYPSINSIEELLRKSDNFVNTNLDSALFYTQKADVLADKLTKNNDKTDVYKSLGDIYLSRSNYVVSLKYFIRAANIIDKQLEKEPSNENFIENKISILNKLGNLNSQQKNKDKAMDFYKKALFELEKSSFKATKKYKPLKVKIYNNIAGLLTREGEYKKALDFLNEAKEISVQLKDSLSDAVFLNNSGICYMELKDYRLAIFYFDQALKKWNIQNNLRGITQCYNNMGEVNYRMKNYTDAEMYFKKALELGKNSGFSDSMLTSLEALSILYDKTQDTPKAYNSYKNFTKLKDSLFNLQTIKHVAQLEMDYKLMRQKKQFEINLKDTEKTQQKTRFFYAFIAIGLLLLLTFSGMLIYVQKTKIKNIKLSQEKLELEHLNLSLDKDRLQEEVAFQNREITSKMIYLMKKNEMISTISDQLIELKKNLASQYQNQIQNIIFEMRKKNDQDLWLEFETYFTKVNPDFYTKLNQLFPDLTPNEKKLCAFLRLNMSTKDISAITYQSVNSIMVSRSRLRKKLKIQGEEQNLVNFLMAL